MISKIKESIMSKLQNELFLEIVFVFTSLFPYCIILKIYPSYYTLIPIFLMIFLMYNLAEKNFYIFMFLKLLMLIGGVVILTIKLNNKIHFYNNMKNIIFYCLCIVIAILFHIKDHAEVELKKYKKTQEKEVANESN